MEQPGNLLISVGMPKFTGGVHEQVTRAAVPTAQNGTPIVMYEAFEYVLLHMIRKAMFGRILKDDELKYFEVQKAVARLFLRMLDDAVFMTTTTNIMQEKGLKALAENWVEAMLQSCWNSLTRNLNPNSFPGESNAAYTKQLLGSCSTSDN